MPTIKLSPKQKEVIQTLRKNDCGIMKLIDGCWVRHLKQ